MFLLDSALRWEIVPYTGLHTSQDRWTVIVRTVAPRYCTECGGANLSKVPAGDTIKRPVCSNCGCVHYIGPALLVMCLIFAEDRLLLVKRGERPYRGQWAPPGGFVEMNESLEEATTREVSEEVGIFLHADQLCPYAFVSLPSMNQVYTMFLTKLDRAHNLSPRVPEIADAGWFTEADYKGLDLWRPASGFDIGQVYARVRDGRFGFYRQDERSLRLYTDDLRGKGIPGYPKQ